METGAVDDRVTALIGIAPPVATSVSGMDYSFPNTLASTKPKFFLQGEADEVCPLEAMWKFYGRLDEPKELVVASRAVLVFDHEAFLTRIESGKTTRHYRTKQVVFSKHPRSSYANLRN